MVKKKKDPYASLDELRDHEIEGRDFRITALRRSGSKVCIIAIHAGAIESGSGRPVDRAVAEVEQDRFAPVERGHSVRHIVRFMKMSAERVIRTHRIGLAQNPGGERDYFEPVVVATGNN